MKIFLDDIPESDSLQAEVAEGEDALNGAFFPGDDGLLRFSSPVKGSFRLSRSEATIFLDYRFDGALKAGCARCLADFEYLLSGEGRLVLYPAEEEAAGGEAADEMPGRDFYSGREIDLGEILREEVALRLPGAPLCREGCLGLCQQCGHNLNEGDCGCAGENRDGRFAVLSNFKPGNKKK